MDSGAGPSGSGTAIIDRTDVAIEDAHAYVANEIMEEGRHFSKINDVKTFTQVQK